MLANKPLRYLHARKVLDFYCQQETDKKASTNREPGKISNKDARRIDWWLENMGTQPPWDAPRTKAYLRDYTEIAGARFFAEGIPLKGGFMHPDRAVMKSLLSEECVEIAEDHRFVLTERGQRLLDEVAVTPISDIIGKPL